MCKKPYCHKGNRIVQLELLAVTINFELQDTSPGGLHHPNLIIPSRCRFSTIEWIVVVREMAFFHSRQAIAADDKFRSGAAHLLGCVMLVSRDESRDGRL